LFNKKTTKPNTHDHLAANHHTGCAIVVELHHNSDQGPVHSAYNPSFSAYFSVRIVFFSHNKSANSVFQPTYQHSQTAPK
jgi:hypothetical protein